MNKFREPTQQEKGLLIDYFLSKFPGVGDTVEERRLDAYESSKVTVIDYMPDGPGFFGTVAFCMYGAGITYYEVVLIESNRCRQIQQSDELVEEDRIIYP